MAQRNILVCPQNILEQSMRSDKNCPQIMDFNICLV